MKQEIIYSGRLEKGNLIEIYTKTIANLGPLNCLNPKVFTYRSNNGDEIDGFSMIGFGNSLVGYIAKQLMDTKTPVKCIMERSSIPKYFFTNKPNRKITLENTEQYQIKVEIESSERDIIKVKKVLDEILKDEFYEERVASTKMILPRLKF